MQDFGPFIFAARFVANSNPPDSLPEQRAPKRATNGAVSSTGATPREGGTQPVPMEGIATEAITNKAITTDSVTTDTVDSAYRRCRELGLRLSKQRRMVLQLLWAEKTHLSARDIFEKLNNLGRNIGHTSVYQNLESLQAAGVIECLDRASGRLYGYRADPHSHLTCLETGAIHDLDVSLPPSLLNQIQLQTGFLIEAYTLNLVGRRPPC